MISALHRSKLFWFGLVGLVFLLWAWNDSRSIGTSMRWQSFSIGFSAGSYASSINLGRVQNDLVNGPMDRKIYLQRNHTGTVHAWFKPLRIYETRHPTGLSQTVVIPYWLTTSFYLAAWSGVIIWYRKRLRGSLAAHADMHAGLSTESPAKS
jgi:hypothetical protein